jgi:ABC-type phosphate transport system permease subunit
MGVILKLCGLPPLSIVFRILLKLFSLIQILMAIVLSRAQLGGEIEPLFFFAAYQNIYYCNGKNCFSTTMTNNNRWKFKSFRFMYKEN